MSFAQLLDLNDDCKLEVVKHLMLDSPVKINEPLVLRSGRLVLDSYRPVENNALTLANKEFHALFEGSIDKYTVYTLHIDGLDAEAEMLMGMSVLPLHIVRYFQLTVDFCETRKHEIYQDTAIQAAVNKGLAKISKLLSANFPGLTDLEIIVIVRDDDLPMSDKKERYGPFTHVKTSEPSHAVRNHVIYKFADGLVDIPKALAVRAYYVLIDPHEKVCFLARSLKEKKKRGWRQKLENLVLYFIPGSLNFAENVEYLGLESAAHYYP